MSFEDLSGKNERALSTAFFWSLPSHLRGIIVLFTSLDCIRISRDLKPILWNRVFQHLRHLFCPWASWLRHISNGSFWWTTAKSSGSTSGINMILFKFEILDHALYHLQASRSGKQRHILLHVETQIICLVMTSNREVLLTFLRDKSPCRGV